MQKTDRFYIAWCRNFNDRLLHAHMALVLFYRLRTCRSGVLSAAGKLLLIGGGEQFENLLPEGAVVFERNIETADEITANIKKNVVIHVFFFSCLMIIYRARYFRYADNACRHKAFWEHRPQAP